MKDIFSKNEIKYVESPVMGGPVQAEEGVLGAIVGASDEDYNLTKILIFLICILDQIFVCDGHRCLARKRLHQILNFF